MAALPRIRKHGQDGRGFAIAGLALGGLAVAAGILAAVLVLTVDARA